MILIASFIFSNNFHEIASIHRQTRVKIIGDLLKRNAHKKKSTKRLFDLYFIEQIVNLYHIYIKKKKISYKTRKKNIRISRIDSLDN